LSKIIPARMTAVGEEEKGRLPIRIAYMSFSILTGGGGEGKKEKRRRGKNAAF